VRGTVTEYKGFTAGAIEFDPENTTFYGTVAGLRDAIYFEGSTAKELARAFRESIDCYLSFCEEIRDDPDRPVNGKTLLHKEPKPK
jgi:predicted HicB family RNase H-like nuclease